MVDVETLYDAAARAGLLTTVRFDAADVAVEFRQPDEDVLNGLAVNRDYQIRYPASRLALSAGDTLTIGIDSYRVREVTLLGDGQECRATLSLV